MKPFWLIFEKFCPQNYGTLKMLLLSTQNNFCIMLNSYVVKGMCKKIQVWISCLQLASRPPKCGCFLENILGSYFGNHFQAEIVPCSPLFFYFQTVFHMVWKNQESWVLGVFGVIGIQKCKIFSADKFFLCFWAAIMDLWIALKY